MKIYCYKRCSTCKKATKLLVDLGVKFELIDYVDNPLSEAEIEQLWQMSGLPLKKFFNTSGLLYRKFDLKNKLSTMSEGEQVDLLSKNPMLIKRPILVMEDKVLVGFNEATWLKTIFPKGSDKVIKVVKELGLPENGYAVFGSGLLGVIGLRQTNDIDIIVTKKVFEGLVATDKFRQSTFADGNLRLADDDKKVELFYDSTMPRANQAELEQMISDAITIEGVKFVMLEDIILWKHAFAREKDQKDLRLIQKYFEKGDV